jgi:hypothetical protein
MTKKTKVCIGWLEETPHIANHQDEFGTVRQLIKKIIVMLVLWGCFPVGLAARLVSHDRTGE